MPHTSRKLLITCGRSDLQVGLIDQQGQIKRTGIANPRQFHQFLLDNPHQYCISDEQDIQESYPPIQLQRNQEGVWCCQSGNHSGQTLQQAEGKYVLYPSKLLPLVNYALQQQLNFDQVLILTTYRTATTLPDSVLQGEPIALGQVLCSWLAQRLQLPNLGQARPDANRGVSWYAFLHGEMDVQEPGNGSEPNHQGCREIEQCIKQLRQENDQHNTAQCYYFSGGGVPQFKEMLSKYLQLYFPHRHHTFAAQRFLAFNHHQKPSLAQLTQARYQAVEMLEHYDVSGAFHQARSLLRDHQPAWLQLLSHFYHYLHYLKWQSNSRWGSLNTLINQYPGNSLHMAIAAEFALKQKDYIRAAQLTVNLSDSMFHDAINQYFLAPDTVPEDQLKATRYQRQNGHFQHVFRPEFDCPDPVAEGLFRYVDRQQNVIAIEMTYAAKSRWLDLLRQVNPELTEHMDYFTQQLGHRAHRVTSSSRRTRGRNPDLTDLKSIRNTITHQWLNQHQCQRIWHSFVAVELWTQEHSLFTNELCHILAGLDGQPGNAQPYDGLAEQALAVLTQEILDDPQN